MPLKWKRGKNPYKSNYFGILELGPNATTQLIGIKADDILRRVHGGEADSKEGDCSMSEVEINEAKSRLLDLRNWAAEVLLVHPMVAGDSSRLMSTCNAILETTAPQFPRVSLRLVNLPALEPLLPSLSADDISLPAWEELVIPGPESLEDRRYDIQFDL